MQKNQKKLQFEKPYFHNNPSAEAFEKIIIREFEEIITVENNRNHLIPTNSQI